MGLTFKLSVSADAGTIICGTGEDEAFPRVRLARCPCSANARIVHTVEDCEHHADLVDMF